MTTGADPAEVFSAFLKLGLTSVGGPIAPGKPNQNGLIERFNGIYTDAWLLMNLDQLRDGHVNETAISRIAFRASLERELTPFHYEVRSDPQSAELPQGLPPSPTIA